MFHVGVYFLSTTQSYGVKSFSLVHSYICLHEKGMIHFSYTQAIQTDVFYMISFLTWREKIIYLSRFLKNSNVSKKCLLFWFLGEKSDNAPEYIHVYLFLFKTSSWKESIYLVWRHGRNPVVEFSQWWLTVRTEIRSCGLHWLSPRHNEKQPLAYSQLDQTSHLKQKK